MKSFQITESNIIYHIEEDYFGKYWRLNTYLHRENGPACEYYDGDKIWYKNGVCHRDDGPAVENSSGYKEYWYDGKRLNNINSDEELKRYVKLLSIY